MIIQAIHDISELCAKKGVQHAILSPGSRCAPLTISFARNELIKKYTFSDERSAAFQAIGISGYLQKPVALVCTSGSAAYNYAPAVAEAFYQQVSLIIFTADRPSEWVDQLDGQTIKQTGIYGGHVKGSYQLPDSYHHEDAYWHVNRIVNEAINLAESYPKGPVHINVPLREPFYPAQGDKFSFSENIRIIKPYNANSNVQLAYYTKKINEYDKVMVVPGQLPYNKDLINAINLFQEKTKCTVVSDIISNLQELENCIRHQDLFINNKKGLPESFKPELLITFGNSIISKNLKIFLRNNQSITHWHLQTNADKVADTFKSITEIIQITPLTFFSHASLNSFADINDFSLQKKSNFYHSWSLVDDKVSNFLKKEIAKDFFSELHAIGKAIDKMPNHSILHLANSMSVRYANYLGLKGKPGISVFSNRGTSGIDGSNSTAYGNALVSKELVTLITGDLAFFYDRNAFWNNHKASNLRVILINNHGGGIFRMIEGPSFLDELEEFFVTDQKLNGAHVAAEFGFQYSLVNNAIELNKNLNIFFQKSSTPKLLEINTDSRKSLDVVKQIKTMIND